MTNIFKIVIISDSPSYDLDPPATLEYVEIIGGWSEAIEIFDAYVQNARRGKCVKINRTNWLYDEIQPGDLFSIELFRVSEVTRGSESNWKWERLVIEKFGDG